MIIDFWKKITFLWRVLGAETVSVRRLWRVWRAPYTSVPPNAIIRVMWFFFFCARALAGHSFRDEKGEVGGSPLSDRLTNRGPRGRVGNPRPLATPLCAPFRPVHQPAVPFPPPDDPSAAASGRRDFDARTLSRERNRFAPSCSRAAAYGSWPYTNRDKKQIEEEKSFFPSWLSGGGKIRFSRPCRRRPVRTRLRTYGVG